ncbi:hypothetical protein L5515_004551 [Caenorhabditis briggsae]|uniref:Beta-adaptin appendage C-terminal subdomain domain-containing protein n=1 Tax=Caenorhabditis briggsae TaxID=6238 RepID=A0AAE9EHX3_CAEBR|nr:hypothetical protein L5515_004551 [Caenorhabditis briggsae]
MKMQNDAAHQKDRYGHYVICYHKKSDEMARRTNIKCHRLGYKNVKFFLQVAIKNNINAFYFATQVPLIVYFREDGQMEKREFLEEWKSIPEQNEQQFSLQNTQNMNADAICTKLQQNNIHTVARRQVDNQQLLYHSVKYTNNLNVLSELKVNSQNTAITLSLKSKNLMAIANMNEVFQSLLN